MIENETKIMPFLEGRSPAPQSAYQVAIATGLTIETAKRSLAALARAGEITGFLKEDTGQTGPRVKLYRLRHIEEVSA